MRDIRFASVTKSYNGDPIIENVSLTIPGGQFFALLGPSGSGKTTLLRLIAGFEKPDSGRIFLGDRDITDVPVNERKVNTVFQNYALFPHMNVFDNVAYGLYVRGFSSDIIKEKVERMLRIVNLEKHLYKEIGQLSGGQQQRVAIARAIINEPEVLLLDEPLAALDLKLRERMLIELIDLQSTLKTTFVYVTHDQIEALTVADKMAIMNYDGEIEQVGAPKEIYEFPVTPFVAQFVGMTNIIPGTLSSESGRWFIKTDGFGSLAVLPGEGVAWVAEGREVLLSIRPEKIEIAKQPVEGFANNLVGTVETIVYHGRSTQYNVAVNGRSILQIFEQNEEHFPHDSIDYGDIVHLHWQKENTVLFQR